jgi:hypothetical protein
VISGAFNNKSVHFVGVIIVREITMCSSEITSHCADVSLLNIFYSDSFTCLVIVQGVVFKNMRLYMCVLWSFFSFITCFGIL